MRSVLSAGARRWNAVVSPLQPDQARSISRVARLLALAWRASRSSRSRSPAGGDGAGALGSQRPLGGPQALIGPIVGAPAKAGKSLYRVVGCRSRGAVVYRHGPARREVAIGFDDGPYPGHAGVRARCSRAATRGRRSS